MKFYHSKILLLGINQNFLILDPPSGGARIKLYIMDFYPVPKTPDTTATIE